MTLRIKAANLGTEPIDIAVTDVISPLGNFGVRPERLTLAPQQEAALDPFVSPFPENFAALEVEIRIRQGARQEVQKLTLLPRSNAP